MTNEQRYREALEKIISLSDLEMRDGDGARELAERALAAPVEPTRDPAEIANEALLTIGEGVHIPPNYDAIHSELLRALYEWNNAGGSIDRVITAIDSLVSFRVAENRPAEPT